MEHPNDFLNPHDKEVEGDCPECGQGNIKIINEGIYRADNWQLHQCDICGFVELLK